MEVNNMNNNIPKNYSTFVETTDMGLFSSWVVNTCDIGSITFLDRNHDRRMESLFSNYPLLYHSSGRVRDLLFLWE